MMKQCVVLNRLLFVWSCSQTIRDGSFCFCVCVSCYSDGVSATWWSIPPRLIQLDSIQSDSTLFCLRQMRRHMHMHGILQLVLAKVNSPRELVYGRH